MIPKADIVDHPGFRSDLTPLLSPEIQCDVYTTFCHETRWYRNYGRILKSWFPAGLYRYNLIHNEM